jgi:hypothetical protein
MDDTVAAALDQLDPVDLEAVEERAALQQRVDRKYFVPADVWAQLLAELADDHDAMVANDLRLSRYETCYSTRPTCAPTASTSRAPALASRCAVVCTPTVASRCSS